MRCQRAHGGGPALRGQSSNEKIGTKTTFVISYSCGVWVEFDERTLRVPVPCLYLLLPRRH
jgi:hypothetical protein